jgi:hypothetical protein
MADDSASLAGAIRNMAFKAANSRSIWISVSAGEKHDKAEGGQSILMRRHI